ncbi:MAG: M1 family peptidase, partial [Bacteroidota bacterium]
MKKIAFAVLMCCTTLYGLSQNFAYRSAENPYYWKNRKPYEGYWQQDVHYYIKATLDDKTDIVSGEQELIYYNNSPDTLNELYFHLYQNAFIKGSYLEQLNVANGFKQQFGKYESVGLGTTISYVKIIEAGEVPKAEEGYAVDPNVIKYDAAFSIDFSIMRVQLKQPLLPGKNIAVQIQFKTYFDDSGTQRRRMKLFKDNWGNKHYDVVHWYPRICVYDRKFGWETDQHLGKEFYGDFGSYDVELTLPNQFIMDGTGILQNKQEVLPDDLLQKLEIKNFAMKPWDSEPSLIIQPNGTTKTWKYKA